MDVQETDRPPKRVGFIGELFSRILCVGIPARKFVFAEHHAIWSISPCSVQRILCALDFLAVRGISITLESEAEKWKN